MRQHAGMAIIVMPRRIQRFLVDRRGDDAGGLAAHGQFHRAGDIAIGGLAAGRAQDAEFAWQPIDGDMIDADTVTRLVRRKDWQIDAAHRRGAGNRRPVPDDADLLPQGGIARGKRPHRYLSAHPGGIPHGDDD